MLPCPSFLILLLLVRQSGDFTNCCFYGAAGKSNCLEIIAVCVVHDLTFQNKKIIHATRIREYFELMDGN